MRRIYFERACRLSDDLESVGLVGFEEQDAVRSVLHEKGEMGEDVESEQGGKADYSARHGFDNGDVAVNVEASYCHRDSRLAG